MELWIVLICFLALPFAAAATYTLYSPGSVSLPDGNITATLYHPDNAVLDADVSALEYAQANNLTTTNLTSRVKSDIAEAKTNDQVYVQTPWQNLFLNYKDCQDTGEYEFCFTSVTYYEEDAEPLGDGKMHATKIVNNTIVLPFVLTINPLTVNLAASRKLTPSPAYLGDKVTVMVTVTNTGTNTAQRVRITEFPPITFMSGAVTGYSSSLDPGDSFSTNYSVQPNTAGNLTFTGSVTSDEGPANITNSVLVVKTPLSANISIGSGYSNDPLPFAISLHNNYSLNITVASVAVDTDERISSDIRGAGSLKPGKNYESLNTFVMAPGDNVTITGALTPLLAVTHKLHVSIAYSTTSSVTLDMSAPFTVYDRGFSATPTVNGSNVSILLNNTLQAPVSAVELDYGGGQVSRIPSVAAGATATVKHQFANAGEFNLTLRYTSDSPKTAQFSVNITQPQVAQVNSSVNTTAAASLPNSTNQSVSNESATQPVYPQPAPQAAVKKSFITRFLDWLASIF